MDFSHVVLSGTGFLSDAYDLFVINICVDIMDRVDYDQPLSKDMKSSIKSMALIGAVIGQLLFGTFADLIGRKKIFVITCLLVILGSLSSAFVQNSEHFGIFSQLCLCRFMLGVGVGGEYPLSASIASESSDSIHKIKNLASVFSMQGAGTLLCSFILILVTNFIENEDYQWRVALGLGSFPMVLAFYFRWKMHETSWEQSAKGPCLNEANRSDILPLINATQWRWRSFLEYFQQSMKYVSYGILENKYTLIGTAGCWFLLDIVFYANGLFSGQVSNSMGLSNDPRQEALITLILQVIAVPGYICSVYFAESIGLKNLQSMGFMITAFFFFALSGLQPYLSKIPSLYLIFYGVTFFFQNFGPNATTYIIPGLVFETSHRATCHGISSALGKLGAIVGTQLFLYLVNAFYSHDSCTDDSPSSDVNSGIRVTFACCAVISILGFFVTQIYIPNDKDIINMIKSDPFYINESTKLSQSLSSSGSSSETSSTNNDDYPKEIPARDESV